MKLLHIKILAWLVPAAVLFGVGGTAQSPTYKPKPVLVNMSAQHVNQVNTSGVGWPSGLRQHTANVPAATPVGSNPTPTATTPVTTNSQQVTPTPNTNKEQVADPNGPTFDVWGNEFSDTGTLIQYSSECVDPISGALNPDNPSCSETASCAPTPTSQDPCKLGQCFGYPYGICESNPNQGDITK